MGAVFSNVDGCCCDEAPGAFVFSILSVLIFLFLKGPEAAPTEPPPRKPQPVIKKQPAPQPPPARVTSPDPEPKPELLVLPERAAEPDVVPKELMDVKNEALPHVAPLLDIINHAPKEAENSPKSERRSSTSSSSSSSSSEDSEATKPSAEIASVAVAASGLSVAVSDLPPEDDVSEEID